MKNLWIILLSVFVGVLLGMTLTRRAGTQKEPEVKIERDTLVVTRIDTIVQVLPQAVKIIRDTVKITDTISIAGQIFFQEVKEYQDSTYYARVSGINAFLEEIRVYPRITTKYITQTEYVREKPKKWGIGVQGGYTIGKDGFYPYLGIGISYNFIQF